MEVFTEISLIIMLAAVVSILMRVFRQPYIVGYILTGVLVGPYIFNLLHSETSIEFLSKLGITILLFIVGLGLNPKVLKEVGKISLIVGAGQIVFTSLVGFMICRLIGLETTPSLYISMALTFSSTIIVLKLLADKGDTDSLYGKISVGLLLVQDLVASVLLILISSFAQPQSENIGITFLLLLVKALLAIVILYVVSTRVLPKFLSFVSISQELLFLCSIAWGMAMASVFYLIGFSVEIGALVAGVCLSATPFASEIGSRMKPLRDFFLLLFFILLGSQMALGTIPQIILPAVILSIFVLAGKPIIVFILLNLLGYKRRTGLMTGLAIAQISEFSLILTSLAGQNGFLSDQMLSLVTLVGLFTIAGSTYLIIYSDSIYRWCKGLLKLLEWRKISIEKTMSINDPAEIVLFGYDRAGPDLLKAIKKLQKTYVVVDFNPQAIKRLKEKNIPFAYGDADDTEFLEEIGINKAQLVVSTIPTSETNQLVVQKLHNANPEAISIVLSHHISDTLKLYKLGASYVVMPLYLGAQYATQMINLYGINQKSFAKEKKRHLKHLQKRLQA